MTQRCPDCASIKVSGGGNGKCSACHGGGKVGTIADDIAGGKRNCERCHGTGQCRTCGGTGVLAAVAPPKRPHADEDINPFDDKVAIRRVCPKCGALDWFEWKFLGRLTDPICGHSWYVGPGTYAVMQIRAAFAAGGKGAKYFTSGVSGEGAWIAKGMGWFMGVLLGLGIRLEFGLLMIPIQAFAGLFQAKRNVSDIVTRVFVLAATLAGLGTLTYQVQHASRPQFGTSQPVGFVPTPAPKVAPTSSAPINQATSTPPSGQPASFTLAVNALNGDFSGVLTVNGQTTAVDRDTIGQYALVSFNSVKDILWCKCPQGYIVSSSSSSTGNNVAVVGNDTDNIEINNALQLNNLTVTCTRAN